LNFNYASIFFIAQFQENEKRKTNSARHFMIGEDEILWTHLKSAYEYDISTNTRLTHRRLSDDHFNLDNASRMRNHLADDVLGKDMLELLKVYTMT